MTLIIESLESMDVKCKQPPKNEQQPDGENNDALRLRIGGYDQRKIVYKGWVILEKFSYRGSNGSFCVMQRDVVCSISPFLRTRLLSVRPGESHFLATTLEVIDFVAVC